MKMNQSQHLDLNGSFGYAAACCETGFKQVVGVTVS